MTRFRGYIFSRKIAGQIIPQRVQNLVIRDYCEKRDHEFLLSATEYDIESSYMMLKALISGRLDFDGVVLYSTHLLPEDHELRDHVFKTLLANTSSLVAFESKYTGYTPR